MSNLYGAMPASGRRITINDLALAKKANERWPMLTCYDSLTAQLFDEAGFPVLLVGDSAGNVVLGFDNTIPVTIDHLVMLASAVVRGAKHAMIVVDLPFGSYTTSEQALASATRMLKEAQAHAVKLEGGREIADIVHALVSSGIPVMGHIGLRPQHVYAMGGYRVQGRGDEGQDILSDAHALQRAGAFSIVLEVIPSDLAARITKEVNIPTIGIGAGPHTDAQVMVWQDLLGLTTGKPAKFVKQYADLHSIISQASKKWADEVAAGTYPDENHSYS